MESKNIDTTKLAKMVAEKFAAGSTLPETIADADKKFGAKTIHRVSPLFWAEVAKSLGPIEATDAALYAARKSGQRREVVALRAGVSVKRVAEAESKGKRNPVYVGRGTKKHLATNGA